MEAGKRLIIEKPVAETQAGFDVLAATQQRLSAHCTVALHAAFGVEVEWFVNELANGTYDDLEFESFHCQFYDPYVLNGQLQPGASSLGGSWIDSGINALSVICRLLDAESLTMSNSRMNRSSDLACLEVQGLVDFTVSDSRSKFFGSGTIETDWTTGQNRKVTTLAMAGGSRKLVLNHSEQTVVMVAGGDEEIVFECANDLPRLTNHYIGVFDDLAEQIQSGHDNLGYCRKLHEFLYQAESWSD
jgi:predicted dehydrogenase